MPFTKLSNPDYNEIWKKDKLSTVNCQDYVDKLNSYIVNSTSEDNNEYQNN